MRQRKPPHHIGGLRRFGAVGFQEFQAGGRGIEKIADFNFGALRERGRLHILALAAFNAQDIGLACTQSSATTGSCG